MAELIRRKLEGPANPEADSTVKTLLIGAVVIAALYVGREVLVPIALAILLTFVLAPLVRLLQGLHFPRFLAVAVVVCLAFAAIFGLGGLMVSQVDQLASDLPKYQVTLGEKIQSLRSVAGGAGTLERASEVLQNLSKEIDKPNNTTLASSPADGPPNKPIPVEIQQPDAGASSNTCSPYHASDPSTNDYRHRSYLRNIYSSATAGSQKPARSACRRS